MYNPIIDTAITAATNLATGGVVAVNAYQANHTSGLSALLNWGVAAVVTIVHLIHIFKNKKQNNG